MRFGREDAVRKGYEEYPYCIVMEAASQSLKHMVDHENFAGSDWDTIIRMTKHLTGSLVHIHQRGFVHGDLKPLNLLLVGTILKVTDLDASASIDNGDLVGYKYSSGYIPPEMLCSHPDGTIDVRKPDGGINHGLIKADPSQDMWALGCILYLLCTGCTLFHTNTEDNITGDEEIIDLYDWEAGGKERRLANVKNKLARNLISLLLNKEPSKRLQAIRVISHPFLSGNQSTRLVGDAAEYDVFISYRVSSDSLHAEMLYDALTAKGLKVWWDVKCLIPGQNWEEGFCSGLTNSSTFICLMSRGGMKNPSKDNQNFEKLTSDSPCDNIVLELRLALELKQRQMIEGIYPVLVGDRDANGIYNRYFRAGCSPAAPDIVVNSVELKLREHLDRESQGLPYIDYETVKSICAQILANQGGYIEGNPVEAIERVSEHIHLMVENLRKKAKSKRRQRRNEDNNNSDKEASSRSSASNYDGDVQFAVVKTIQNTLMKDIQTLNLKVARMKDEHHTQRKELGFKNEELKIERADLLQLITSLQQRIESFAYMEGEINTEGPIHEGIIEEKVSEGIM